MSRGYDPGPVPFGQPAIVEQGRRWCADCRTVALQQRTRNDYVICKGCERTRSQP